MDHQPSEEKSLYDLHPVQYTELTRENSWCISPLLHLYPAPPTPPTPSCITGSGLGTCPHYLPLLVLRPSENHKRNTRRETPSPPPPRKTTRPSRKTQVGKFFAYFPVVAARSISLRTCRVRFPAVAARVKVRGRVSLGSTFRFEVKTPFLTFLLVFISRCRIRRQFCHVCRWL